MAAPKQIPEGMLRLPPERTVCPKVEPSQEYCPHWLLVVAHQGVREVRGDLRIVARHASGLPLAVEAASGSGVIGVQWHPEIDGESGAAAFESLLTAIRHRDVAASSRALV